VCTTHREIHDLGCEEERKEWDVHIARRKVVDAELAVERDPSVEEDDDREDDCDRPRKVRLERGVERQHVAQEALCLHAVVEPEEGDGDTRPGDHRAEGSDATEPHERLLGTGLAHSEETEQTERGRDGDGVVRDTLLVDLGEDARDLTLLGKLEEGTGRGVHELVSG
jgi:hypothetical protein